MNIDSIFPGLRDNRTSKSTATTSRGVISKALSGNNEAAKTLESGQKITGEVLSNDGTKLTLKLPGNMVLNARMEQSVAAGIGDKVTFLVKSNDGGTVQLQPLMENLAGQGTAMKALQAAGLVANDKTITMTMSMMEQGMSIGKNNLTAMYAKVLSNPQAQIQNLVQMTKMDIPVNATNVEQFENYKNFEGVIRDTFQDVLDMLTDSVENVFSNQGAEAGLRFVANVMELVSNEALAADFETVYSAEELANITANYDGDELASLNAANEDIITGDVQSEPQSNIENQISVNKNSINNQQTLENSMVQDMPAKIAAKITESLNNIFSEGKGQIGHSTESLATELVNSEELGQIKEQISSALSALSDSNVENIFSQNENLEGITLPTGTKDMINAFMENGDYETAKGLLNNSISDTEIVNAFKKLLSDEFARLTGMNADKNSVEVLVENPDNNHSLASRLFSNERFQSIFKEAFLKQSMLKPEELSKENVGKLFEKMVQNTRDLLNSLENAVPKDAPVKVSLENVRENIQFMDNINQAYSFVQIPIKMNSAKSEGDLYVYTNKKGLAGKEGQTSAYLHLDMENLGVVNCYVKMNSGQKVSTNFYLEDEASLDLIEKHLPELTKRLTDRGYSITTNCEMTEPKKDMMDMIMEREQGSVSLSHLAFDVRA